MKLSLEKKKCLYVSIHKKFYEIIETRIIKMGANKSTMSGNASRTEVVVAHQLLFRMFFPYDMRQFIF